MCGQGARQGQTHMGWFCVSCFICKLNRPFSVAYRGPAAMITLVVSRQLSYYCRGGSHVSQGWGGITEGSQTATGVSMQVEAGGVPSPKTLGLVLPELPHCPLVGFCPVLLHKAGSAIC